MQNYTILKVSVFGHLVFGNGHFYLSRRHCEFPPSLRGTKQSSLLLYWLSFFWIASFLAMTIIFVNTKIILYICALIYKTKKHENRK